MLLWELAFERIPYDKWDMSKIKEHVLDNKREKITFGKESPTIQKLQQDYSKIIVSGKRSSYNFFFKYCFEYVIVL